MAILTISVMVGDNLRGPVCLPRAHRRARPVRLPADHRASSSIRRSVRSWIRVTSGLVLQPYHTRLSSIAPAGCSSRSAPMTVRPGRFRTSYDSRVDDDSVIPDTKRFTFFAEAGYELTDRVDLYVEGLYNRRKTKTDASRQLFFYQFPGNAATGYGALRRPTLSARVVLLRRRGLRSVCRRAIRLMPVSPARHCFSRSSGHRSIRAPTSNIIAVSPASAPTWTISCRMVPGLPRPTQPFGRRLPSDRSSSAMRSSSVLPSSARTCATAP